VLLFRFFVRLVLTAERAEFAEFNPLGGGFLVLGLRIIAVLAFAALESNDFAHDVFS